MKQLAIPLMELLAIPLGYQKTAAKWLVISNQKTVAKWLVIAILLMKLLAIPLGCQRTTTKWLVISRQKALHSHSAKSPKDGDISHWLTATKWLVMLRCVKNFLLTYQLYVARLNFLRAAATRLACLPLFRALLTIPHGAAFARSGSASPCGAFGRTLNFYKLPLDVSRSEFDALKNATAKAVR